jgi:uncharacterized repeat protein (TIGR03803 family)
VGVCFLGSLALGQVNEMVIHSFGGSDGEDPSGKLVLGSDGMLYGGTVHGGTNDSGTVFKMRVDGTGFTVLHRFGANANDGVYVMGDIAVGTDGYVYGTTTHGGLHAAGTVFKVDTNGVNYTILYNFTNSSYGVPGPTGVLIGQDGWLYGTLAGNTGGGLSGVFKLNTSGGGYTMVNNAGHLYEAGLFQGRDGVLYGTCRNPAFVFKVNPDGSGYHQLHTFDGTNGGWSQADLIQGADGALYGTTLVGGADHEGVIFRLTTDGSSYTVLHSFSHVGLNSDNDVVPGSLLQAADGRLYGMTSGEGNLGDIFSINTDGSDYEILWRFGAGNHVDGWLPPRWSGLVQDRNGVFYGSTERGGGTSGMGSVIRFNLPPAGYSRLHHFGAITNDAEGPSTPLVQARDGALYGTTTFGGTNHMGTVFKLNPDGTGYRMIRGFSATGSDGQIPNDLRLGSDGVIYGTTECGGSYGNTGPFTGYGTLFNVNSNGVNYLYNFAGGNGGRVPIATPAATAGGLLYGTTVLGGSNNLGTVFKINTNGSSPVILYNFGASATDGIYPSRVVLTADGWLYGTTEGGSHGVGTIFKLKTNGQNYLVLHQFATNNADGQIPSGLLQASDGWLYGSTEFGGSNGMGSLFKISTAGTGYALIHHFGTGPLDGQYPVADLIQAGDGALYGTTQYGGNLAATGTFFDNGAGYPYTGSGTLFRIYGNGTGYTQLYQFAGDSKGFDGNNPGAALMQANDGALYGTTQSGGSNTVGTIFRLTLPGLQYDSLAYLANKTFEFSFSGTPNATYRIDASTNLFNWVTLTNLVNTNGPVHYIDREASQFPRRFYRSVWLY